MQVEGSGANEDYAGIVMETDWSEDDPAFSETN